MTQLNGEEIKICKWFEDSKAPVVIWCDDIGGAGSKKKPYQDAGWAKFCADTGARRVHMVMKEHPQAVLTYFIVPDWSDATFSDNEGAEWGRTQQIDDNSRGFTNWLEGLSKMSFYDFQLHGLSHQYKKSKEGAKHEFEYYEECKEAEDKIQRAIKIFESAFNKTPTGNRFPAWKPGKNGYEAMKKNNLKWCSNLEEKNGYEFNDGLLNLPIGYKIDQMVTDDINKQLDNDKGVYITSHVEGYTPTARINTGIYQNYAKLHYLLSYIEQNYEDIWWASGEEVARYIEAREKTEMLDLVKDDDEIKFRLEYSGNWDKPLLSLKLNLDSVKNGIKVELPNGNVIEGKNFVRKVKGDYITNIPVMDGEYTIKKIKNLDFKAKVEKEKPRENKIKKDIKPVPSSYNFYDSGLTTRWNSSEDDLDEILKTIVSKEVAYIKKGFFVFHAKDVVLEKEVLLKPPFEIIINPQSFDYWALSLENIFTEVFIGFIMAMCNFLNIDDPIDWMKEEPLRLLFYR